MFDINEEKIIIENENGTLSVGNYLYGSCHLFALSLSEKFGYEIGCVMENDGVGTETYLVHAFCYFPDNPDLIIDAGGIRDKESTLESYPVSFTETFEIGNAKDIILDWMKIGRLSNYGDDYLPTEPSLSCIFKDEKEIIDNFIEENKNSYDNKKMKRGNRLSF